jgi:hypothetical protein
MLALFLFQSGEIAAFASAIEIGLKHGPALEFTGSAVAASVSLLLVPAPSVYLIANIGFGVFFGVSFSYLMGVALQANSWMLAVSPARMLRGRNRTGRVFW